MFPTFISILDIQSWWEVPSIAHFCSLFRTAFNLLDFDIEDLEEALLTDGTEESSWLQELIVKLLSGCLPNNEISTFNYQMFLRRLFRQKCQEHDTYNPFNTDIDFQLLPLRTKVDILHALCDFRLDAEDVLEQLKNLEADSLRVEPLGYDSNNSAYWYFYGTRLYREDFHTKNNKKKSVWQVICFTEDDWFQLAKKFKKSTSKAERQLYNTLNENFLPELPRLFKEKERLARKRLLENQPRRTSNRLRKLETETWKKRKDEQNKIVEQKLQSEKEEKLKKKKIEKKRREAYERRSRLKELSEDSESEKSLSRYEMTGAKSRDKKAKGRQRKLSEASTSSKDTFLSKNLKHKRNSSNDKSASKDSKPTSVGRQTNNSLAAATGQIVIQSVSNPPNKKKLKTSQVFRQTDEDLQTGMHKILDYVKNHEDAWPFADPVDEDYAPNYYTIIRKPMDLQRMEDRLDSGYYNSFSKFRTDFQLIVDNCRLYNGAKNEYTEMVDNLQKVFERATEKYLDQISSSDDEIAIEYNVDSENDNKSITKKRKSDTVSPKLSTKRKPVLTAQTDKKRDRSVSEDSLGKKRSVSVESSKIDDEKSVKSKKHSDKVTKKQTKISKSNKHAKEKEKEKQVTSKKPTKEKNVKQSKSKSSSSSKKEKKLSPDRSMSRTSLNSSPPPSDCSSPPPSWPPSSPDSRFDFSPKKHNKKRQVSDGSDEENSFNKGKQKKHLKRDDDGHQHKKLKRSYSPPVSPKPKDKHNKLRETIEKLKAKSEISNKIKSEYDFHVGDTSKENKDKNKKSDKNDKHKQKNKNKQLKKDVELEDGYSTLDSMQSESKKSNKKSTKQTSIEALTLATEQTLKDINKWLDDTPKYSEFSSASNSPLYGSVVEDVDSANKSNQDPIKKIEKPLTMKKDSFVKDLKRRQFRDPAKFFKRREIQRTIDRLQPGKSKGNLISTVQNTNKTDEVFPLGPLAKVKDTKNSLIVKTDTNAPKLSLGSVLDSFGKHKFVDDQKKDDDKCDIVKKVETTPFKDSNNVDDKKETIDVVEETKENTDNIINKDSDGVSGGGGGGGGGGATPNLSAWFKAFGAPKIQTNQKKNDVKSDGKENEKTDENRKVPLPDPSPNPDSPVMTPGQPIPRQRKISTGSSMSERSSFSQDMDSPRVGIDERLGAYPAPYPSPLHRSPSGASPVMASPRPDVSPKAAAYPTFNGQIRVGFYQDTVSNKSSPDKSCSPRDNSQSPAYVQYSEHYSPNNTPQNSYSYTASPYYNNTPNFSNTNPTQPYNTDMSNSSYYDTNKSLTDQYQAKSAQNYTANSPASNMSSPISHQQQHSPTMVDSYQQPQQQQQQHEEQHKIDRIPGPQSAIFPVKKRAYNETEINNYNEQLRNQAQDIHINEQKENKDMPKPYIHQNIPDPKSLNMDNYNKGPNNIQQQQQQLPPPTDMRNFPPTTASNTYNSYNTDPNYMNVPPSRSLTSPQPTLTDLDRKVDMNKYTNMGYNGPDVNFSRNLQQYNRPELNYTRTTPSSQQQQQQPQPPQSSNQPNDMHMRYVNPNVGIHMNYKSMEINPNQQHPNYNTSTIPQNSNVRPQDVPTGYKQTEVSIPRPTYTTPSIDVEQSLGLRGNIANLSHIVDRCCPTDDRMLSGLQTSSTYYTDKGLSTSHMFNKPISTSASPLPMFSQGNVAQVPSSYNQNIQPTPSSMYNRQLTELQSPNVMSNDGKVMQPLPEKKTKKRKNAKNAPAPPNPVDPQQTNPQGFQSYAGIKNNTAIEPSAISLKTSSVVPGSAFNFGPTPSGIGLTSGLYGDKDAYHPNFLDEFRSAPNYYMAAAAAAHHRSTPESTNDKQTRVASAAHQSTTSQGAAGYQFLGAPQSRSSYPPFMPPPPTQAPLMDPSSPLYQHYLQAGVLNQSLLGPPGAYPPGYHPALSMRQPYDSMTTRSPWL